ncbi:MAG: undecaprenyl-diphosphate phosphatase [Candidatus Komeilibacteria bacterium]|mgnify:CR=1 FL=1|jgi:undecaprenyl-diphosphatase|nr:undecaprenyl-diphosphate phosphatase [Candidatus Komeilibacteria bacterium]MBT4447851.1 undecaprenyl-diphosphate phosphatase [Candidatus Komeilibacteria bacterium]
MEFTEALILSIVQGIAEWLPISSSGHLVLFEKWLDIKEASLSFDIFLHIASLAVILLFFKKQIIEIIKAPFDPKKNKKENWWWYVIISNIFTAIIGYHLYQNIESFRTVDSVANWLLITAILLLASKFTKGGQSLTWKHAVVLGIVQGFAVLPGLSRSGVVIVLALAMKIKKTQAFDYGFIVAIPAMLGSFLLTARGFVFEPIYILAFVLTFIIGYLSLILLKLIMKRDYFYLFFVYTLILSLIIKLT